MSSTWPWLLLIGLGAFHGLNPAMGWLFAVALGLHRQSRAVVLISLIPIALGHALAIALVVYAVTVLGTVIDQTALRVLSGVVLIAWGAYGLLLSASAPGAGRDCRRGCSGCAFWSFLMATAHGAGFMLIPALEPLQTHMSGGHMHDMPEAQLAVDRLARRRRAHHGDAGRRPAPSPSSSINGSGSDSCGGGGSMSILPGTWP